ncbi:MAG: FHA domain-containing protein [Chloroflexaceae bacterium]|nr:FHA domain-containing protein [Chloroflexaceae bacterium]
MLKIKAINSESGEILETVFKPNARTKDQWIMGRASSCDLILNGPAVSRVHGRIVFQEGNYFYSDLGSSDGSRLNNQQVNVGETYPLKAHDTLYVGEFFLILDIAESTIVAEEESVSSAPSALPTWQGDLAVRCVRIVEETVDVKTFSFAAEPPLLFSYKPGQFVTLDLMIAGKSVKRSYSISSTPSRPHLLEITVKRVPTPPDNPDAPPGLVSNWLHDNVKVGSEIKLKGGPLGKFTCADHPGTKLLFISAGSGITPMVSMSRWLYDTASKRDVVFFHSARTPSDIILREELEQLSARWPNFTLAVSTTRPERGRPWMSFSGRLSEAMLMIIAPDFRDRTVYVCGPGGFMEGVKSLMAGLNFPMENYFEESFGGAKGKKKTAAPPPPPATLAASNGATDSSEPAPTTGAVAAKSPKPAAPVAASVAPTTPSVAGGKPMIVFAQSGQEIAGDDTLFILDLAEENGISLTSGCRAGSCGACKVKKREGEVAYDGEPHGLDSSDQAAGYILTCIARPVGRVVVEA